MTSSAAMIGVVGGGQLARMLVQAAAKRQIDVSVQTGAADDPAVDGASRLISADPRDVAGTRRLVEGCNGITFENEWVNIDALIPLEQQGVRFRPALAALSPLVDKLLQRQLLTDLSIACPPWIPLSRISPSQPALPTGWSFPVMAKAARGGYDGKGTLIIKSVDELAQLLRRVTASEWLLSE